MEKIHENVHVFVQHESTKTCMFPCKFCAYPLHQNGKGKFMDRFVQKVILCRFSPNKYTYTNTIIIQKQSNPSLNEGAIKP